jgi:hypothetical protein
VLERDRSLPLTARPQRNILPLVEQSNDEDSLLLDSINQSIRIREELPDGWIADFANNAAAFGKSR